MPTTNKNTNHHQADLSEFANSLPAIIPRHRIADYLPGLLSRGYLQNLDSIGKGPISHRFGGKVVYLRDDLLSWISSRINK